MDRPTVFISYSHPDEAWKDRLTKHLRTLESGGILEVWDDRKIAAGADWASEIEGAISRSAVAVLIVSTDFLTSPFILQNEVPHLIRRRASGHLRIIPVIVHPCPWQEMKWLASLQCRPKDGKALSGWRENEVEEAFAALAREIKALVSLDHPDQRRQAAAPPPLSTATNTSRAQQPRKKTTSPPTPPLPHGASQRPRKKSLSPLSWIGIGCAILITLAVIAFGGLGYSIGKQIKNGKQIKKISMMDIAKLVMRDNPDFELVKSDEKTNTLTIKDKKTGEVDTISANETTRTFTFKNEATGETSTMKLDDKSGKLTVKRDKGQTTTMNAGTAPPRNLPAWLPVYPDGKVQGSFDSTTAEGHSATFTVSSSDSVAKMMEFYESQLKSAGLKVEKTTFSANGQDGGTVTAKSADEKRQVNVLFGRNNGQTVASVTYQEKK